MKTAFAPKTRIRNDLFNPANGLDRGRPFFVEAVWYLVKCTLFLSPLPFPSVVRRVVLRWFGARIGKGVVIKPRVNIHLPWKLFIGDYSWIGEEVYILNFEPVRIGAHCCVSQRAFLCGGNHDYGQTDMRYRNQPITLEDGTWIGAQSFVAPGVTICTEAVISAGSIVTKSQPPQMVCGGNPCSAIKSRWPAVPQKKDAKPSEVEELLVEGFLEECAGITQTVSIERLYRTVDLCASPAAAQVC